MYMYMHTEQHYSINMGFTLHELFDALSQLNVIHVLVLLLDIVLLFM